MYKKVLSFLLAAALTFSFFSCSDGDGIFSYCELRIPLSNDFYETENENFDATYSNGTYAIAVLRISFVAAVAEGISETMSAYEFGAFWIEKCSREANLIGADVPYCEYYESAGGKEFFYLEAFYRSAYAYFVVLFTADSALEEAGRVDFLNYAKNLYFTT